MAETIKLVSVIVEPEGSYGGENWKCKNCGESFVGKDPQYFIVLGWFIRKHLLFKKWRMAEIHGPICGICASMVNVR